MKTKFEKILNKYKPVYPYNTYINEKTFISGVYIIEETFVKTNVNLSNFDRIIDVIQNQDLTLIFFKITIDILDNDQKQEYNEAILLDSELNIKHEIKIGSFQISYFGEIKNDRNQIMKKGEFHMFKQPFYGRVILGENRIACPSENEYLYHYNNMLTSLKTFINEPFNFFPWTYLMNNSKFNYQASFYSKNEKIYSNILQIQSVYYKEQKTIDAVVIMMNPGSRKPTKSNENILSDQISNLMVDCIPDETQYQIARLMELSKWNKVTVINLLDFCETESTEVYQKYQNNLPSSSIFSDSRMEELNSIFNQLNTSKNVIVGWGVSSDLNHIKNKALDFIKSKNLTPVGLKNKYNDFYHPWPRENEEFRKKWPHKVYDLLNK